MESDMESDTQASPVVDTLSKAIRSESVCTYLKSIAGVLSSIVNDINTQLKAIKAIEVEEQEGEGSNAAH